MVKMLTMVTRSTTMTMVTMVPRLTTATMVTMVAMVTSLTTMTMVTMVARLTTINNDNGDNGTRLTMMTLVDNNDNGEINACDHGLIRESLGQDHEDDDYDTVAPGPQDSGDEASGQPTGPPSGTVGPAPLQSNIRTYIFTCFRHTEVGNI